MSAKAWVRAGPTHDYRNPVLPLSEAQNSFQNGKIYRKKLRMEVYTLPVPLKKKGVTDDEEEKHWEEMMHTNKNWTNTFFDAISSCVSCCVRATWFCWDASRMIVNAAKNWNRSEFCHWRMLLHCSDPTVFFWFVVELETVLSNDGKTFRIGHKWSLVKNSWARGIAEKCFFMGEIKTTPEAILKLASEHPKNGEPYLLGGMNCQDWVVEFIDMINESLGDERDAWMDGREFDDWSGFDEDGGGGESNGKLVRPEGLRTLREEYTSQDFINSLDAVMNNWKTEPDSKSLDRRELLAALKGSVLTEKRLAGVL